MKTVLFFIILFAANVIQAVTGFAGTLLAMPVSIQLIGVLEAKVILNIMAFASCLWITVQNRRYIQYKILGKIILWMGIGMIIGVWIFDRVSLDFLLPCYGIFILLIALKKLLIQRELSLPGWLLTISLLAAGVIHGMFVSGGALLVVYASSVIKDKNQFRATVAPVWVILNLFLMISDESHGYMTPDVLALTGLGMIPLFLAIYIGNKIQKKINQAVFLKITYILLVVSGISVLVS